MPANTNSAVCQENASISPCASGENRNCPNEPAAVPAPNAKARQLSGTSLPSAPITIGNEQPARPKPMITPAERSSASVELRVAIQARPMRIEDCAGAQHAHRAETVGDAAGERLRRAPEQVLHGDREREGLAAPAVLERQRRQELAERRARAERDQRDGAADRDQHASASARRQASAARARSSIDIESSPDMSAPNRRERSRRILSRSTRWAKAKLRDGIRFARAHGCMAGPPRGDWRHARSKCYMICSK